MVSKILLLAFIVGTASAATWIGNLPKKPSELAHKEGCYVREINDVIPFNTYATPVGNCVRIACSTDMMDYASCGTTRTDDPNCHIDSDLSKTYPNCCPNVKCDLDNNLL